MDNKVYEVLSEWKLDNSKKKFEYKGICIQAQIIFHLDVFPLLIYSG